MFAFGQLKLKPWEFDEYTMQDFMFAWYGYQESLQIQRLQTWFTIKATASSDILPRELWALYGDEPIIDKKKLEERKKQADLNWNEPIVTS